ncbi:MAG: DedA family protein [Hyphomicrobiales bacterium]|nr:DedA family protein [Hyphomicrobiales bacterium]
MATTTIASLTGLGLTSFLSATILPMSSEAVLAGMAAAKAAPVSMLLLVAGIGNTLGSCVNWLLGLSLEHFRDRRWFPVSETQLERAQARYNRWGWPSLLLSWVPLIGDPLTVVAGLMRTPFLLFLTVVAIAKFGRYAVILWLLN